MFKSGKLMIDKTYQRRAIWVEKDEVLLIETLLLGYIIPELFFWVAETNPDTGEQITHIVDGQQRINAIVKFIDDKLKLGKQHLENSDISEKFGNKIFNELSSDDKKLIWNYQLDIISIDSIATSENIKEMFRRLNKTEYGLNAQERRNSLSGDFATLANEISNLPIWEELHLFKASDVKRMRDIEFCASLILLHREAIIDQTTQAALNKAYIDLQTDYDEKSQDKESILKGINSLEMLLDNEVLRKFAQRKSQLYTIFSVIFYTMRNDLEFNKTSSNKLKQFIDLYNLFDNELNIEDSLSVDEKAIYDSLKKYKLASSEGVNKQANRKIRFDVLKDFIFAKQAAKRESICMSLLAKMQAVGSTNKKYDDIDD
jgi:hypothetical protein